jgi:hypothetical protein
LVDDTSAGFIWHSEITSGSKGWIPAALKAERRFSSVNAF